MACDDSPVRLERSWKDAILGEWVGPPPETEWTRKVNDDRIVNQDRIRPFLTRGALLVLMIACLMATTEPRWAWALFGLALLQTMLEIAYEPVVRAQHEDVALRHGRGRALIRAWYSNYQNGISNFTGLLGLAACVANLWVVMFGSGPMSERAWPKVGALACAVLYTASGALGPLMDGAAYNPASTIPRPAWVFLRLLWVPVIGIIVVAVLLSERIGDAWGDALPYAVLVCLLGYYPMLRVREFERAVMAGWTVADRTESDRSAMMARDLHHLLQPVKDTLLTARDALQNPADRRAVADYVEDVEYVYRAARERRITSRDGLIRPLEVHLQQVADGGLIRLESTIEIDRTCADDDYRLAKQCLVTLLENTVQAYATWVGESTPSAVIRATSDPAGWLVAEVTDALPPVPDATWRRTDTTLGGLRADIEARGGRLEQVVRRQGKSIRGTWPTMRPLRVRVADQGDKA